MSRTKRYDHMCHPPKFESDTQSWQLRRAPGVMPDSPVAFMEKTFVAPYNLGPLVRYPPC